MITNLELDHHSRWGSLAELSEAFAAFAAPASGLVKRRRRSPAGPGGPARAALRPRAGGRASRPRRRSCSPRTSPPREAAPASGRAAREIDTEVSLRVPGRHNVANALAALGGLSLASADVEACARALAGFPGVARRLELKGEAHGARIYDDYAHHPTEVAATLEAARDLGPRRLIVAFQPHLYSRTKALATEFGAALAAADEVAVLDVYPAREEPVGELEGVSGMMVAQRRSRPRGRPARLVAAHGRAGRPRAGAPPRRGGCPDHDRRRRRLQARRGPGERGRAG